MRPNHAERSTQYAVRSMKQYRFVRTPVVLGQIEILSRIEGQMAD